MTARQVPTGAIGAAEYAALMEKRRQEIAKRNAPSRGDQYLRSRGFRKFGDPSPQELLHEEWERQRNG